MVSVSCVTKNSSMMICGNIVDPSSASKTACPNPEDMRRWLASCRVKSFYTQLIAGNYRQGAASLMQTAGVGKFKPNVVFMG